MTDRTLYIDDDITRSGHTEQGWEGRTTMTLATFFLCKFHKFIN